VSEERWEIPDEWEWSTIEEICQVNQRDVKLRELPDDLPVSFVPMAAVDAERGVIATPEVRPLSKVRKGFTPFADGDVIFAKITPCMENGKAAIARGLTSGLGFGSTEFHVMRPGEGTLAEWVFYFVRREAFRNEAKSNFAGTAGQLRVPFEFIRTAPIPRAPLPEQRRIVAKIERLFEQSRTAREALDGVPALMKRFRQSVLASAFRGELTERDPNDEPASVLLERIRAERREKFKGKKYVEPELPDTSDLSELPNGWEWTSLAQLSWDAGYGTSQKCSYEPSSFPVLRIPNLVKGNFDLADLKYAAETQGIDASNALEPGDLVIVRTNGSKDLIGRGALVRKPFERPHFFASYLIRFRIVGVSGVAEWLDTIWPAQPIREWIEQIAASSAGQYNVSVGRLNRLPVPLPPSAEQRRIVAKVEALFAQADAVEREVESARRRAEKVDQAILARAFRGEL
jgi:type I restriction enzyme S subunit